MPQIFNFRPETLFPLSGPGLPAVLHSKCVLDMQDYDSFLGKALVTSKLASIFDDCYRHFSLSSSLN